MCQQRLWLWHSAGARPFSDRQVADVGVEKVIRQLPQMCHISRGLRMRPHVIVHGRNQEHRRRCGEQDRGEEVVGLPCRCTRQKVRRCRSDYDHVGRACQFDVIEGVASCNKLGVHRPSGQRLEGDRSDELPGGPSQDDVNLGTSLRQKPRQPGGLVAGDSPGDA